MMASVAWPYHALGSCPLRGSNAYESPPDVLRTDFEAGESRQRQHVTTQPTAVRMQWRWTAQELAIFEAWHRHKLGRGAAWFDHRLYSALGIRDVEARFVGGRYSAVPDPNRPSRWLVDATIEIREMPTWTEGELDAMLALGTPDGSVIAALLDGIVNTDMPAYFPG